MPFTFNPFTGNFDVVKDITEKVDKVVSTDNAVTRFNGTEGDVQNSGVTIDDSNNVIIPGDLTVNGTTTSVNSTNLEVTDKNITVNNSGNDASSEGAGITVERTSTDASFVFESALASKWKLGLLGSEVEIADISSSQTFTNKTIDADNNTILDIANSNIAAAAAIQFDKMQALSTARVLVTDLSGFAGVSTITTTELGTLSGISSNIQTQLDTKAIETRAINTTGPIQGGGDLSADRTLTIDQATNAVDGYISSTDFTNFESKFKIDIISTSGVISAAVEKTYLINTSSVATITLPAPSLNASVIVKDSTGSANANNITVNPNAAETIDGGSSFIIDSEFEAKQFISDGTNWFVL